MAPEAVGPGSGMCPAGRGPEPPAPRSPCPRLGLSLCAHTSAIGWTNTQDPSRLSSTSIVILRGFINSGNRGQLVGSRLFTSEYVVVCACVCVLWCVRVRVHLRVFTCVCRAECQGSHRMSASPSYLPERPRLSLDTCSAEVTSLSGGRGLSHPTQTPHGQGPR